VRAKLTAGPRFKSEPGTPGIHLADYGMVVETCEECVLSWLAEFTDVTTK